LLRQKSPQNSFFGSYLYDRIIPPDHLLRKINQVVDFSFITDLVKDRYNPDFGRPAEDPEFMLRLCLLQYLYGDSDRKVIENARVNLAYKYFLGLAVDEEVPDDTTMSFFRAKRLGEEKFKQVFQTIVQQCIYKGLVTGKHQLLDSTHVVADIAINSLTGLLKLCQNNVIDEVRRQSPKVAERLGLKEPQYNKQDRFARKEDHLERVLDESKELLDGVTAELKRGGLRINPGLRDRLQILEKAVADREEGAKDRLVSPVDPDARMGKKNSKRWAGYKGHLVVEEESEIITAVETTPANQADGSQLKPLLSQQEETHDLKPQEVSADKAYDSGANLEHLESKGIVGNISLMEKFNHRGPDLFAHDDFKYDAEKGTLTCPAGCVASHSKRDVVHTEDQKRKGILFQFTHRQCHACELKDICFNGSSKIHGRAVHISVYEPLFQRMKERMASEAGQEAYSKRYKIEHKIADLVRRCGMRHCRYRGLVKAKIHTLLSAITSNIKRMARLLWRNSETPPFSAELS
jgi:transposase